MNYQNKSKEELLCELQALQQKNNILKARYEKEISERNIAKDASQETYDYLDSLFKYANVPIIVWNTQCKITRFNKAFEILTGRTEKDVIGKSIEILFPPTHRDSSMKLIEETFEGERWEVVEINILHIDGSIHTLLWNSANIMSSDGKTPISTIAQGHDITNRILAERNLKEKNEKIEKQNEEKEKRATELIIANEELIFQNKEKEKRAAELFIANKELHQLLQLNADKDRFISILAHDLKSPFNSILGFLELLKKNVRRYDINKIESQISIINCSAQNVYNLLEAILMWARSESGNLPYNPQKLSLNVVCSDILEIFNSIANVKNITISCFIANDLTVFADLDMLKAVMRNLISNALKFTKEGGQVNINAEKTEPNLIITVSDNGIGITPEIQNKLFYISQMHTTRGTENESGSGLGLLLCKNFIEKHGGKIWVESKFGVGSDFKFTMPLCNE